MAEQPKPVKNSLLSATSSSFFEDAALFVPVPLVGAVEAQEPATAEIDLNSDDSPPNRASVEKEFEEQLKLSETVQPNLPQSQREAPSTISLFSRAASTGGDLFSRMMSGPSAIKPTSTTGNGNQGEAGPVSFVPSMPPKTASSTSLVEAEEEAPSVVSLFSPPPIRPSPTTNVGFMSTPTAPSNPPTLMNAEGEQMPSTASLFSASGPSAFVPTNQASTNSPSFQTVYAAPPNPSPSTQSSKTSYTSSLFRSDSYASGRDPESTGLAVFPAATDLAPSANSVFPSGSAHGSGPMATPLFPASTTNRPGQSAGPLFASSAVSGQGLSAGPLFASSAVSGQGSSATSALYTPSTVTGPVPSTTPLFPIGAVSGQGQSSNPLFPSDVGSGTSYIHAMDSPSAPSLVAFPGVPMKPSGSIPQNMSDISVQKSTPPMPSGGGNVFRLGAQRMKYVPCPEMQPAPSLTPAVPQQNMAFNPMANTTSSPFIPAPVPVASATNMGANYSTAHYTQGPVAPAPPSSEGVQAPLTQAQRGTPQRPTNNNGYYGTPGGQLQAHGPQELPPLTYHWFYRKDADGKPVWKPFSIIDSVALEDAFAHEPERNVPTDGGRYDVCVQKRLKNPVYWEEAPIEVRRGSWFFKGPMDNRFVPYDEDFAARLESEYGDCMRSGVWQKRLEFPGGESVIMHSAGVVVHFCQAAAPDDWGNLPESQIRPRVVKRGVDEIEVDDGESSQIDHLVFVVHGIGPICDFKLRNIVEAVDDFRGLSFQLLNNHFRESIDKNLVGRVEFLPVSWHKSLHGDRGIDEQLKRITLRSIPKFRDFTNDTLLDILFYTSPVYCQTIIDSVGSELNRIYKLFLSRNPSFTGNVSLTGHSLGSLILFDLLAHQPVRRASSAGGTETGSATVDDKDIDLAAEATKNEEISEIPLSASSSRTVSYTVGTAGTGQPYIIYPKIDFKPTAFFALGSPISMFVTIRGIEKLGNDFRLPTCPAFFNIFHPYDPVAYRIETMIDPDFQNRPVLIPHHKGRKRIHLELKETMARVGADIKHKVLDAVKTTLNTVYHYTGFSKTEDNIENEIQSAIAGEMEKKAEADGAENENTHIQIGSLNGGRRIDHVLQEAPYETFNEYVFAMSTHVGYWESEDTMLLILTEIYGTMGIQHDCRVSTNVTSPTQPLFPTVSGTATNYFTPPPILPSPSGSQPMAYQPTAPPFPVSNHMQTPQAMFNMSPAVGLSATQAAATNPPPPIPMIHPHSNPNPPLETLLPPNPVGVGAVQSPTSGNRPYVIGNRPVTDPSHYPRGMDPTAPMLNLSPAAVAPPPRTGFVRKQ